MKKSAGRTKDARMRGFTLVEIMITMAIIALIVTIAIPQFMRARRTAGINICISNLKKVDEAKSVWAVWEGGTTSDTPGWGDLVPDYIKKVPACPTGGSYTIGTVDAKTTCSVAEHVLFVGWSAVLDHFTRSRFAFPGYKGIINKKIRMS